MSTEKKLVSNTTAEENKYIKNIYKNNEHLLKITRAGMLGLDLEESEKELLRSTYSDKNLVRIITKRFVPTVDKNAPIGQIADVWLGIEQQVFGQPESTIEQAVQYKDLAIKMSLQSIDFLQNPDGEQVSIDYDPNKNLNDPLRINLLARNQYLRHVEQQLLFLKTIAEQADENEEEKRIRELKDSSK